MTGSVPRETAAQRRVDPRWLARRRWARVGWVYGALLLVGSLFIGVFYVAFVASLKTNPLEWPFDFVPPQLNPAYWATAAELGRAGSGNPFLGGLEPGREVLFEVSYFVPDGVTLTPPEADIPRRVSSSRLVNPPPIPQASDYASVSAAEEVAREALTLGDEAGQRVTYRFRLEHSGEGPKVAQLPLDLSLDREAWLAGARVVNATLPPARIERRGRVASWDDLTPGFIGYTFQNYVRVFRNTTDSTGSSLFWRWIVNTFVFAGARVLAALVFASMAGYALARLHFPGRTLLFLLVLFSQMVPAQVTFISNYLVLRDGIFGLSKLFGVDTLLNTLPGLIIGGSGATALVAASSVFIMKQFFESVPIEIEEAARIDGANPLQTFFRIVYPMARPALGALTILTFQGNWNEFFWPLVVLTTRSEFTLPIGLLGFRNAYGPAGDWGLILAGAFLSMIPVLILFIVFQRYFVEGASFSGLKG